MRRGRFAPTPSGLLHIGNAFAAVASWLQMRQANGQFALRVEDIDTARSRADLAQKQLDDLRWLGIDWDEGPDVGGRHAPYVQSERMTLYEAALERLEQADMLYPCYCSRSELARIASAPHGLASEGGAYPGLCRHLSEEERQAKGAHKTPALRFKMAGQPVTFRDGWAGEVTFAGEAVSDFVVKRADGMFSYQLAVTVDDAAMGITDVLRGADLLDSTPRQLALYEALGLTAPSFAHVPLILGANGERLSKRDRSITLASLRDAGVAPERLIGVMGFAAGWIDRPEPVSVRELIPSFRAVRQREGEPQGRLALSDSLWRMLT
ncbi:tRNA glutamyl-Q(34) synthetase GluQRS [Cohnella panacarvi]|uniref:tRNA glutamyl-Q(34) synthetase GluQRS n=1 Tax=Cohnella panacarvi TaxID=400776 RepID=UPI000550CD70|nr:tRNA glutamyl-Q(34) synthetase GluQRS [Cohnella panacarvi]